MRQFYALLVLAIVISTAVSLLGLDRRADVELARVSPLDGATSALALPFEQSTPLSQIKSEHFRLLLGGQGYENSGVLRVRFEGGTLEIIHQNDAPYETRDSCKAVDEIVECSIMVRATSPAALYVIQPLDADIVVHSITLDFVTAKRSVSVSGNLIIAGFIVLLALGPVLVFLRRWDGGEQAALAVLGLAWISVAGLQAAAIATAFLVAGYFSIIAVRDSSVRTRPLMLSLVGVLLTVFLLKFAAPLIGPAFANPGGFALAFPLGISYLAVRLVDMLLLANAGLLGTFRAVDYAGFMLMPHTLPAGPILTFPTFQAGRIEDYSVVDFGAGTARMAVGISKKIVADSFILPHVSAHMGTFLVGGAQLDSAAVVPMLLLNTLYVYFDFSAYCDLAIGAGRAAGRKVPENFDWPLLRSGIRNFWRHWHMTLSQWVMRRVYFPAFLHTRSVSLATVTCMLVIGLWHSLVLPWIFWAVHHGLAMSAEARLFGSGARQEGGGVRRWLRWLAGTVFVWCWVSLGHSFTLFASTEVALRSYIAALTAPLRLAGF